MASRRTHRYVSRKQLSTCIRNSGDKTVYWRCRTLAQGVQRMGEFMRRRLETIAFEHEQTLLFEGGMALGFDCKLRHIAEAASRKSFGKGLVVERRGPVDQVIKVLPALAIESQALNKGLEIFEESLAEALNMPGVLVRPRAHSVKQ